MSVAEAIPVIEEEAQAFKAAMRHLAAAVSVVTTGRGVRFNLVRFLDRGTQFGYGSVFDLNYNAAANLVALVS